MHLAALHIYPVKSLRGLAVQSAGVDSLGAIGDRRFLVVDPAGVFLTQRTAPRMALVAALLDDAALTLRSAGFGEIRVRRAPDPGARLLPVRVWSSEGLLAEDCGDAPASWLGGVLGTPCRLVRIGPAFSRPVKPRRTDIRPPPDAHALEEQPGKRDDKESCDAAGHRQPAEPAPRRIRRQHDACN